MIAIPGSWKSIEELEDNVSLDDLMGLLTKFREMRHEDRQFTASLQGHDLKPLNVAGEDGDPFERALKRAQERILQEQESDGPRNATDHELSQVLGIKFNKE
jgi:hypothetical protein